MQVNCSAHMRLQANSDAQEINGDTLREGGLITLHVLAQVLLRDGRANRPFAVVSWSVKIFPSFSSV